jgi:outer membrane protein TolC
MSVIQALSRLAGISLIVLTGASSVQADTELMLAEAERLAIENAPWLQHHHTNATAAGERSMYESRLPDPQLILGALNVPTDSFRLDREDMTMTMVGIRQVFPPGKTLRLRGERAEKQHGREQLMVEAEQRNLLRQVRATWLELYLAQQSLHTIEESRRFQQRQLAAAEGRYRAAAEMPQVVLKAREALARLEEREPTARAQIARQQAQLSRWIGEAAYTALPPELPTLPAPASEFDATRHPEWLAAQAMFDAAQLEVAMAREEYKPGMMLDLSYGFRRPMPDGTERPDMVTAMVTFDLPVFRAKRQDRRLAEKQAMETGARFEEEDKRRELEAMFRTARAEYEAAQARMRIFSQTLLPAVRRQTEITVAGFARDQTEYREATMRRLETELDYLRARIDLAKAQSELLYLTGETP